MATADMMGRLIRCWRLLLEHDGLFQAHPVGYEETPEERAAADYWTSRLAAEPDLDQVPDTVRPWLIARMVYAEATCAALSAADPDQPEIPPSEFFERLLLADWHRAGARWWYDQPRE